MAGQTLGPESSPVRTWELVSFSARPADGRINEPWGAKPAGRITYDADGHVTALLMHELRNEADGRRRPAETQGDFSAYFGTYRVDVAQGLITHQVTASLSASHASGELQRNYAFTDGMLVLSFYRAPVTNHLIWKRISPAA